MGRKSKLDEKLIEQMYDELKEGLPLQYACDYFGITRMTHLNWMKQGEDDYEADVESLHATYFASIKKAQAEYVRTAGREIRKGESGWQGKAWWLERTRQDFMPKQQIQADDDGKVTVVIGGKVKETKRK